MRTRLLLPALLSGVLALGACGGAADDDGPESAADPTTTTRDGDGDADG